MLRITGVLAVSLCLTACGDKQTEAAIVGDWTLSSAIEVCDESSEQCAGFSSFDLTIAAGEPNAGSLTAVFVQDSPTFEGTTSVGAEVSAGTEWSDDTISQGYTLNISAITNDGCEVDNDEIVWNCSLDDSNNVLTCNVTELPICSEVLSETSDAVGAEYGIETITLDRVAAATEDAETAE